MIFIIRNNNKFMPTCNILSHSMIFVKWDLQKWGDLCCWQQPDITYEDFLTGLRKPIIAGV